MVGPVAPDSDVVGSWDGVSPPTFVRLAIDDLLLEVADRRSLTSALDTLWFCYEERILARWRAYTSRVEAHLEGLRRLQLEMEAGAAGPPLRMLEGIGAQLERKRSELAAKNSRAVARLNEFVDQTNAFLMSIWERVGPGLDIPPPDLERGVDLAEGSAGEIRLEYEVACRNAAALSSYGELAHDPILRRHLWWLSLAGAGIAGLTAGLVPAIAAGGAVGTGTLLVRLAQRGRAAETYGELARATARRQRAAFEAAASEVQANDIELRRLEVQLADRHTSQEQRLEGSLSDVQLAFAEQRRAASVAWLVGVGDCADVHLTLSQAVGHITNLAPELMGPLRVGGTTSYPAVEDRLSARVGEFLLEKPNPLSAEARAAMPAGLPSTPDCDDFSVPALWRLSSKRSLLVSTDRNAHELGTTILSNVAARLLSQIPPGKLRLHLFDPLGVGRDFGAFLKLKDHSAELIGRVGVSRDDLRSILTTLSSSVETITQDYLRNDFEDVEEYNVSAGEVAEPYRLLVVCDFPNSFDDVAFGDLCRILQHGPRCGVYVALHANVAVPVPHGIDLSRLREHATVLEHAAEGSLTASASDFCPLVGVSRADRRVLSVDPPIDDATLDALVAEVGRNAQDGLRTEVSYSKLLQLSGVSEPVTWSGRVSAVRRIEVPLGPTGARKVQYLTLGGDSGHHALLVGRTGSGKSNLLHVIITAACRFYTPAELQLYLIDFKEGVEFKAYATAELPHARVIAIRSEREFGLSVLQALDGQLAARGRLFSAAGVQDLADYNAGNPTESLPRLLLVLDEFQRLFEREDAIAHESAVLLERLARQGRNFGINMILGTQSLAGAGLNRATMDQMAIRIVLPCSEADSRLVLADDLAVRALSRPGEGIYNDGAGAAGRSAHFQAALLTSGARERELSLIAQAAVAARWQGPKPNIFDDFAAGDLANCPALDAATGAGPQGRPLRLWMGEATSLAEVNPPSLRRESGSNLLVMTRDQADGLGCLVGAVLSVSGQSDARDSRFYIVDLSGGERASPLDINRLSAALPQSSEVYRTGDVDLLKDLSREIQRRRAGGAGLAKDSPSLILVLLGVQFSTDLRLERDSYGFDAPGSHDHPVAMLTQILEHGPEVGIHCFAWCDTWGNFRRALGDGALELFGIRVSGKLSARDSDRMFDDQVASSLDKPHRVAVQSADIGGQFELLRAYGVPDEHTLAALGTRLRH